MVIKERKQTSFGKRSLLIPESTIGKILKKESAHSQRRVRREYYRLKYQWDKILPFAQMDTKEILDKRILPRKIYSYIKASTFIPHYQWTLIKRFWRPLGYEREPIFHIF